jgi:hypothetical protein
VDLDRPGAKRRWITVALVALALVATPIVVNLWPVAAKRIDPKVLFQRIMASDKQPYQAYAETRGTLILPSIPQLTDVATLLGASSSVRVWHASPTAWRVAVLDQVGEKDVYTTGEGTYTWDYGRNLWTRIVGDPPVRVPWASDLLPPDLARRLLAGNATGDKVESLAPQRVAGVTAAGIRFTPGDPDTTISHVDVWADANTGLPLKVDVPGAFTARFLDVALTRPADDVLTPKVSAASGYSETDRPDITSALNAVAAARLPRTLAGRPRVEGPVSAVAVYGDGLSRFVVVALPGRLGPQTVNAVRDAGGAEAPGGYVVGSAVLTVLASRPANRRTYLLAGFVTADLLKRAAGELR